MQIFNKLISTHILPIINILTLHLPVYCRVSKMNLTINYSRLCQTIILFINTGLQRASSINYLKPADYKPALSFNAIALLISALFFLTVNSGLSASINNPADITNLVVWLDASDPENDGSPPVNGSPVSTWYDKSGNGNNATQANPAYQPEFISSELGNKGVLRFNSDFMSTLKLGIHDNFTVIAVANSNSSHQIEVESSSGTAGSSGQNYLFGADDGATEYGSTYTGFGVSMGTNGLQIYDHSSSHFPALAVYNAALGSRFAVMGFICSNKEPLIYYNNKLVRNGITSPESRVYMPDDIGGCSLGYGYLNGDIVEVIMYSRVLTDQELNDIEEYLINKWKLLSNIESDFMNVATKELVFQNKSFGIQKYPDSEFDISGNVRSKTVGYSAMIKSTPTTIDWRNSNVCHLTADSGANSVSFTNPHYPCSLIIKVNYTSSAGVSWDTPIKWQYNTVPPFSNASGKTDIIGLYFDGTNYYGVASLDFQ